MPGRFDNLSPEDRKSLLESKKAERAKLQEEQGLEDLRQQEESKLIPLEQIDDSTREEQITLRKRLRDIARLQQPTDFTDQQRPDPVAPEDNILLGAGEGAARGIAGEAAQRVGAIDKRPEELPFELGFNKATLGFGVTTLFDPGAIAVSAAATPFAAAVVKANKFRRLFKAGSLARKSLKNHRAITTAVAPAAARFALDPDATLAELGLESAAGFVIPGAGRLIGKGIRATGRTISAPLNLTRKIQKSADLIDAEIGNIGQPLTDDAAGEMLVKAIRGVKASSQGAGREVVDLVLEKNPNIQISSKAAKKANNAIKARWDKVKATRPVSRHAQDVKTKSIDGIAQDMDDLRSVFFPPQGNVPGAGGSAINRLKSFINELDTALDGTDLVKKFRAEMVKDLKTVLNESIAESNPQVREFLFRATAREARVKKGLEGFKTILNKTDITNTDAFNVIKSINDLDQIKFLVTDVLNPTQVKALKASVLNSIKPTTDGIFNPGKMAQVLGANKIKTLIQTLFTDRELKTIRELSKKARNAGDFRQAAKNAILLGGGTIIGGGAAKASGLLDFLGGKED